MAADNPFGPRVPMAGHPLLAAPATSFPSAATASPPVAVRASAPNPFLPPGASAPPTPAHAVPFATPATASSFATSASMPSPPPPRTLDDDVEELLRRGAGWRPSGSPALPRPHDRTAVPHSFEEVDRWMDESHWVALVDALRVSPLAAASAPSGGAADSDEPTADQIRFLHAFALSLTMTQQIDEAHAQLSVLARWDERLERAAAAAAAASSSSSSSTSSSSSSTSSSPAARVSPVPIGLRLLAAQLPMRLGLPVRACDFLGELLARLEREIRADLGDAPVPLLRWTRDPAHAVASFARVACALGATRLAAGHSRTALALLEGAAAFLGAATARLDRDATPSAESRAVLAVQLARAYLAVGDVDRALETFPRDGVGLGDEAAARAILALNRGLVEFATDRFSEAAHAFEEAVRASTPSGDDDAAFASPAAEDSPEVWAAWARRLETRVSAAGNWALALLHGQDLVRAIVVLEEFIASNPSHHMRSGLVSNLCVLYDLARDTAGAQRAKEVLRRLASRFGLEHLPAAAFRIGK